MRERLFCLTLSLFTGFTPLAAVAKDVAGTFDYYVMSLSWSPTWCSLQGAAQGSEQCRREAGFGWILHGLWPQYETGYPEYCETGARDPSRADTGAMADIMGTGSLAWHEWKKHGRCSGLTSGDYFALSRQAYEKITLPAVLNDLTRDVTLPAGVIEEAFIEENPHLTVNGVTVTCEAGRIDEVRICLTRDLKPRDCAPDVRRDCTLGDALFEARD